MKPVPFLARIASIPLAFLLVSASPADRLIPHPDPGTENEALIIPHDSPVKFRRWDKYGYAQFDGSFVLTGTFTYGCVADCEGPVEEEYLRVDVVPDPAMAARLPHWKVRDHDMSIVIVREKRLAKSIASPRQHAALRAGKIQYVRGRVAIAVDDFRTGIECDSANFTARFVAIAEAPKLAPIELNGDYGCL